MDEAIRPIHIDDLAVGPVIRQRLDDAWIDELVAIFDLLPPVLVAPGHELLDGRHRVEAARRLGRPHLMARVVPVADAAGQLEVAARANQHGLKLTLDERRSIVDRLLEDAPALSDRRIAAAAGMSPTTVGARRRRLEEAQRAGRPDADVPATADVPAGVHLDTSGVQMDTGLVGQGPSTRSLISRLCRSGGPLGKLWRQLHATWRSLLRRVRRLVHGRLWTVEAIGERQADRAAPVASVCSCSTCSMSFPSEEQDDWCSLVRSGRSPGRRRSSHGRST